MYQNIWEKPKEKSTSTTYVSFQFNPWPSAWICDSRIFSNQINEIQEKARRIMYNDHDLSFMQLLEKDHPLIIHENLKWFCYRSLLRKNVSHSFNH